MRNMAASLLRRALQPRPCFTASSLLNRLPLCTQLLLSSVNGSTCPRQCSTAVSAARVRRRATLSSHPSASDTATILGGAADALWLGMRPDLVAGLLEMGITAPSEIQSLAFPAIAAGNSVVLTAATGTGKSLAYLVPLLHRMKNDETERHVVSRRRRPRVLVLVPTRELAVQVCAVAKKLCHTAKFRVAAVVGGTQQGLQRRMLDSDLDVVIATPGRLAMLLDQGWVSLRDVTALAIDEVDTMVNQRDGFGEELRVVLSRLGLQGAATASQSPQDGRGDGPSFTSAERPAVQVVLAGATIPRGARTQIRSLFPGVSTTLTARSAHRAPPSLVHRFIRVAGDPDAKHEALMRFVHEFAPTAQSAAASSTSSSTGNSSSTDSKKAIGRLLVFCNTIPSARSTAFKLVELGYNAASLHGGIPPKLRADEFEAFRDGRAPILVCTDAAARGLDLQDVDTVLMFDFPLNAVEYLHRAGRVARAGRRGTAISLVAKGDTVLARGIKNAVDSGAPIADISSSRSSSSSSSSSSRSSSIVDAGAESTGSVRPARSATSVASALRRSSAVAVRSSGGVGRTPSQGDRAARSRWPRRSTSDGGGAAKAGEKGFGFGRAAGGGGGGHSQSAAGARVARRAVVGRNSGASRRGSAQRASRRAHQ